MNPLNIEIVSNRMVSIMVIHSLPIRYRRDYL